MRFRLEVASELTASTHNHHLQGEADIAFADDAVVASDGRIFFSDATAIAAPRRPDGSYDVLMASKATFFAVRPLSHGCV